MSFFITLVEGTDAMRRDVESLPKVQSLMHDGLSVVEYRSFLHDLYHIVWHFCPTIAAAAGRCDERHRHVRFDLYQRIEEERGHDEWVLEDIRAMGGDVDAARELRPPSAPIQAMIGFNYYAVERVHPCAILGMLYALEVVSSVYGGKVSDSIARALERDVAAGGFRFLSSHATLDVEHMADLNRLLNTIDDPTVQDIVVRATRVNFHQLGQMFQPGGAFG